MSLRVKWTKRKQTERQAAALHKCVARVGRTRARHQTEHAGGERVSFVSWYITGRAAAATCCTLFQGGGCCELRESAACAPGARGDGFAAPVTWHKRIAGLERESKESLSLLLAALLFNGGAITLMGRSAPQIYRTQFVVATPARFCNPTALAQNKKQEDKHTTRVTPMRISLLFLC